ncbi:MAG: hypothetical protein COA69_05770 [Robiginitomaculum sp.]|nr:MAG: hypothetical protein COA69_05770 [Robiginitomaculum sp.]
MTVKHKLMATTIAAFVCLSGCQTVAVDHHEYETVPDTSAHEETQTEQHEDPHAKPQTKPHWEYTGSHGPAHWAELSDEFTMCATGRLQSPFNITVDIKAYLPALGLGYNAVPLKVLNNGHTIQVDQADAGQLSVDGKTYNLLQFHFHAHSEHTIDGKTFPLEMHLVHASAQGELAVVGVMIEEGAPNAELAKIWQHMPSGEGEVAQEGLNVEVRKLLPASRKYARFMGSLTTPPCSEGVNWHMLSTPITASAEQIAAFKAIFPMNARPLQSKNNRLVVAGK